MSSSEHVDDCVIRWWRGYVKSCFFVVDESSPEGGTLIESPFFWSLGLDSLEPEGEIAAAHELLVERLVREGWEPAGVGETWYEHRFVRATTAPAAAGDCVIRWWRGYVKSCFFAVVDESSPEGGTLIESPFFWSVRKRSLTPEGEIAAAHERLVERLVAEGWQPVGVGEAWYEQRFVREGSARAADEQPVPEAPAEAPSPKLEPPEEPVRPTTADDRPLRVVPGRAQSRATPPASRSAAPKRAPRGQAGKQAQTAGKSRPRARARPGTSAGSAQPPSKTAAPRHRRPPTRATGPAGRRRARASRRSRHLATVVVVLGWALLAVAVVAALLLILNGS